MLKCNEELWNEIKPVLESFGVIDFNNLGYGNNKNDFQFKTYPYLVSNYENYYIDRFLIGNIDKPHVDEFNTFRYLVDTKEEFLSAVAKLLGKEYSIKEQSSEVKYPCIKCTQQLYDKIKNIFDAVGCNILRVSDVDNNYTNYLIINAGKFGDVDIVTYAGCEKSNNRYLCSNIQEFLTKACELKGYIVSYINNTRYDDAENHYFGYCANNETKTIDIYENAEESGLQAIVVEKSVVPKKKKENDLNINKDMEKINIADKLKHCKKGTKLYSPLFGEVEFENIDDKIEIITHTDEEEIYKAFFEKDGKYYIIYKDAECLLFPSKDNRNWNDFQVFEEGHRVMVSDDAHDWCLRLYVTDNKTIHFNSDDDKDEMTWKYIVPVEDFDFTAEDITINKEKSII